jgi:HEPN domain-containing protein
MWPADRQLQQRPCSKAGATLKIGCFASRSGSDTTSRALPHNSGFICLVVDGTMKPDRGRNLNDGNAVVNRTELQRLAQERIGDAKVLLAARRWPAAYYLAGYAVECALKACIAKLMKSEELPDKKFAEKCWTHNLKQLLDLAGLKVGFDAALKTDPDLLNNWNTVEDWNEGSRYDRTTKAKAENLYEAITEKKHGVLSWLKRHW